MTKTSPVNPLTNLVPRQAAKDLLNQSRRNRRRTPVRQLLLHQNQPPALQAAQLHHSHHNLLRRQNLRRLSLLCLQPKNQRPEAPRLARRQQPSRQRLHQPLVVKLSLLRAFRVIRQLPLNSSPARQPKTKQMLLKSKTPLTRQLNRRTNNQLPHRPQPKSNLSLLPLLAEKGSTNQINKGLKAAKAGYATP